MNNKHGPCACCGEPGQIIAHGWREACYHRWYRAGKPDTGPPPRKLLRQKDRLAEYVWLRTAGEVPAEAGRRVGLTHERTLQDYEALRAGLNGRWEEYRELTRDQHYTPEDAAAHMGIRPRTAERYEAGLRALGIPPAATHNQEAA